MNVIVCCSSIDIWMPGTKGLKLMIGRDGLNEEPTGFLEGRHILEIGDCLYSDKMNTTRLGNKEGNVVDKHDINSEDGVAM